MSKSNREDLLKTITTKEVKEICKHNGLKGYSPLKQKELVKFAAKNLPLSSSELQLMVSELKEAKLIAKIKDSEDFILRKAVKIESCTDDLITASIDSLNIKINNLGDDDFSFACSGKCKDYLYRVRTGQSPFCKHYPAVIGELICQDNLKVQPNHISGKRFDVLMEIVDKRKKEDGIVVSDDRNIDNTLSDLKSDLMEISTKNTVLAREKYGEIPEKVFKTLVNESFQLLEYETIFNRRTEGWDLLVLGTYAPQPYIMVINCRAAQSGTIRDPQLLNLKNYCTDMCKNQVMGAYKDYVKYMVVVAPDFPEKIPEYVSQFQEMTEGLKLSFLPVSCLLYLVEKYKENPILTHYKSESLFKKDLITKKDIDELFEISEEYIVDLCSNARSILRKRMENISQYHSDACYIKMDEVFLNQVIEEIISSLNPHLLKQGVNDTTGIKTVNFNHDYYVLWERLLHELADEFTHILKEQSMSQVQRSGLKEDLIKYFDF